MQVACPLGNWEERILNDLEIEVHSELYWFVSDFQAEICETTLLRDWLII